MPDHEEQNDLRAVYAAKPDGELLQLASENEELIDAAKVALAEEMAKRKLVAESPGAPGGHDEIEGRALVTVAHFMNLMGAQLAMTILESAGVPCFLRNENMVRLGWSAGIGGIDVQVDPENVAIAKEVLEQAPQELTPEEIARQDEEDPEPPTGA